MDDDLIRVLMQEVKNVHIDRKLKEKMDRHDTTDRPRLKEFVNNLDMGSDSSDDNSSKKINNYLSDKGERYDSSKMPNLNLPHEMWEKTGDAETCKNLGAIPKKPYNRVPKQNYNNNNNNNNNNNFAPRRNRDNSTESNRSSINWQRRPNARRGTGTGTGTGRNDEGKRRETDWNKKVFNRDSNSNFKQRYPFYYKVPENPVGANPLPPGTYLVIPQTSINFLPLKIISHAQGDSSERNNGKGKCGSSPSEGDKGENSNENDEEKEWNKSRFDKEKSKETKKKERGPSDEPRRDLDNNGNPPGSHDREKPSEKEVRALFAQFLPFYDTDRVLYEFYERGISVEEFVTEMVQRKRNEIQDRIFEEFPDIDVDYLEEYIKDALENYVDVEDFIRDRKRKMEKELFESVTRELPDIDIWTIKDVYNRYKGSADIKNIIMKKVEEGKKEKEVAEMLTLIYNILPDMDPKFVSQLLDRTKGDRNNLNDILLELLESMDYPKVKETDATFRDKMKLWRYYVSDFTVENFLEKVPEPEETFSSLKERVGGNGNEEAALTFLQMRYPVLERDQIKLTLGAFHGSISNACLHLDKFGPFNNNIGAKILEENFDELFLQEACYCIHRKEILEFIKVENERRKLETEVCRDENGFLECVNCYDDEVLPSDIVACPDGHLCCKNCLVRYVQISYGSGKSEFVCLSDSCENEYGLHVLEKLIGRNLFLKITEKRAMADVEKAGVSGLEKCPSCHYAYIPDPEDKVFRCENVDCFRITCRLCKEDSHLPLSCNEVERPRDVVARKRVEEAMSKKLVRYCPGCKKGFVKMNGCNKISCSCGTISCYLCSAVVIGYDHFMKKNNNTKACPLFSDNHELHVKQVEEAGEEEKEVILREDKNVKFVHDPTRY